MNAEPSIVFVVDDDPGVRDGVQKLLLAAGVRVQTFGSTADFLAVSRPDIPACLVLDVQLPDSSGLDLQRDLTNAGVDIPIIFITRHGAIPMSVQAMKAGAVEFLTKPFRGPALLAAIQEAVARDRAAREQRSQVSSVRARYDLLTAREKEVMALVATGLLNKQIAGELGTSELTIKTHRARVMQKMEAESVPDLVRMHETLKRLSAPPK